MLSGGQVLYFIRRRESQTGSLDTRAHVARLLLKGSQSSSFWVEKKEGARGCARIWPGDQSCVHGRGAESV